MIFIPFCTTVSSVNSIRLEFSHISGKFNSLLQANVLQYFPGKPFSRDNYRSLQMPSTCKKGENVLHDVFGIEPTAIETEVPRYLMHRVSREQYMDFRRHARRE